MYDFFSEPLRCVGSRCSNDNQCYGSTDWFGNIVGQNCGNGNSFLGIPDRCIAWLGAASPCGCYCDCANILFFCSSTCGPKC